MNQNAAWTEERINLLTQLWADGLSASQVAAELGGFPSCRDGGRSAVIGKIHRLGLHRTKAKPRKKKGAAPSVFLLPSANSNKRIGAGRSEALPDIQPSEFDVAIPVEQRRTFMELTNYTCRYPIGDPRDDDFYFCGAETANFWENRPYCDYHSSIANQPYQPRVRRPFVD